MTGTQAKDKNLLNRSPHRRIKVERRLWKGNSREMYIIKELRNNNQPPGVLNTQLKKTHTHS